MLIYAYGPTSTSAEKDLRGLIPSYFQLGSTLHLATDCNGFAAKFEVRNKPQIDQIEFDLTKNRLTALEPMRGRFTDRRKVDLNPGEYLIYKGSTFSDVVSSLNGLDNLDDLMGDNIWDGIICWQSYDKKNSADTTNAFRSLIKHPSPITILVSAKSKKILPAIYDGNNLTVFGSGL